MKEVFIISGARTPIGKLLGGLSSFSASDLGGIAIKEAVKRAGIDKELINEVIMGNVVSAGIGQAPARQALLKAELPNTIGAVTINKVCGSGLKSIMIGSNAIRSEEYDVIVAGGMESMTNVPFYVKGMRNGVKFGDQKMIDGMVFDGLFDPYYKQHMGEFGDYTAEKAGISREEQDEFAFNSHQKAIKAREILKEEIVSIEIKDRKGNVIKVMDIDEGPRESTSLEKLARLRPAFSKNGTITAGNAPGLNDGAGAVVLMSGEKVKETGVKPLAKVLAYATSGKDPKDVFFAPPVAIKKVMDKLGMKDVNEFDLIEINEAFSAQVLANVKELGIDMNKLNVNGGAVAIGHPIGASGSRILVTLIYELRRRGLKKGVAALCLGGGNAVAMVVEVI